MKFNNVSVASFFCAAVALAACGAPPGGPGTVAGAGVSATGRTVGATCAGDRDCEFRCVLNNDHYPGGFCTIACANDTACPAGTSCVDDNGGICAPNCNTADDCTMYGRGFACDSHDRRGASGSTSVCRVP